MNKVINVIMGESQSAFVLGKVVHDNIIIAHELLRENNKKHIPPRCAIQIDIHKAFYDTVEWIALESIMIEMNFPAQFIKYIMVCFNSASYKYNINGNQSKFLKAKRGLR